MVACTRVHWAALLWPCLFAAASLFGSASAANSTSSSVSPSRTSSASTTASGVYTSLSLTTSYVTIATTITSGGENITVSTALPATTYNVSVTLTSSSSAASASNSTAAASNPYDLDTKIDPAFGVLGGLLILTGLPSAFLGHKNRWSSFFLIGCYTLSLVCLVLILKFGVLAAVNPPSTAVRGLFMLACGVAGIVGGGIALFFWQVTKYFVGAWGGFVVAMWVQCFKAGGLISPIGFRWILYIIVAAIGFILCTIPKIHYHILLLSTAFVGATALILGIDCFTTGGLKEFYMWNLGFTALFPKYTNNGIEFPINQTMEVELGLMGAVSLMGIAVQFQVLRMLQRKLKEIKEASKRHDEEMEDRAAMAFTDLEREKAEWEREHPTLFKHGRQGSQFSSLLKDNSDERQTPSLTDRRASGYTLVGTPRQRYQSGVSDFLAAAPPAEELNRSASKALQTPGALPLLDLGNDIETDVPQNFIAESDDPKTSKGKKVQGKAPTPAELEDLKRKEELLAEIQTIRKSIEILKSETPDPSSSSNSRHPSFTSRTLSQDLGSLASSIPSHLRPPRQADPRARVQSMELSNLSRVTTGGAIGRPISAPLRDDDWDAYVRDRKLLQPPSGITPPIATTPISPTPRTPIPPAVEEALLHRHRLESALSASPQVRVTPDAKPPTKDYFAVQKGPSTSSEIPAVLRMQPQLLHNRSHSQGVGPLVTILPPHKQNVSPTPKEAPAPQSPWTTHTFEELTQRHREKIRELQEPITRAEKEQVDVAEARRRWERAKEAEKQAVAKRQAEKAAALSKEATPKGRDDPKRKSKTLDGSGQGDKHERTLSAGMLASVPGVTSSKRMSMLKVEDWQKHQQDVEMGLRPTDDREQRSSRRRSAVPFPETTPADTRDRRQMSGMP